ncbi:MAG: hypothetical protein K2Y02_04670 [Burkholderiaceae bacterium]|nr:hypothetical protein [Burkholderiaceae bacterium]
MNDANSKVARAIRDELTSFGLVLADHADTLEAAISAGTVKAEDWYRAVEASLPEPGGSTDAGQAK